MRTAASPAVEGARAPKASAGSSTEIRDTLASALYVGRVSHRRHAPEPHAFTWPLFMAYLDLGELERVFARRWLWSVGRRNVVEFRRSDFLGDPALPLDQAVRDCVAAEVGHRPAGPVRMLTHLRMFGHSFNPVTFYYCFATDGRTLDTLVAQITNTPWKERHTYVLPVSDAAREGEFFSWTFDKQFHVSPFMAMEHDYGWRFQLPGDALRVHMDVLCQADAAGDIAPKRFDATLTLQRRPMRGRAMAWALLRFPLMTLQVVAAIHWHALRLWLRGNPIHDHPDKRAAP
ncbi:DUF1365 domain-containing protein [Pseudoxanthomonas sp. GM95]|uniref:DUF1365 domain-containing protein n=1 Tax=Pseudoxanthomonas sp. GM95 TaxID=1881043 RepID=UPI000B809786|nr:DUF1365 domain-containing protein [Pseudoxanthomonas sp. GM95]